jgi:hypothetical protein
MSSKFNKISSKSSLWVKGVPQKNLKIFHEVLAEQGVFFSKNGKNLGWMVNGFDGQKIQFFIMTSDQFYVPRD